LPETVTFWGDDEQVFRSPLLNAVDL